MDEQEIIMNILDNTKRNAIPAWQGYHYQAQVAIMFLLQQICEKGNEAKNISIRLEWIEDFAVIDKNEIKKIIQVKKTLNKSELKDVLYNFVFEYLLDEKKDCEWFLVYDNNKMDHNEISEENIYATFTHVKSEYIVQVNKLLSNIENWDYIKSNLGWHNKESELKIIRRVVRQCIEKANLSFNKKSFFKIKPIIEKTINIIKPIMQKANLDTKSFKEKCKIIQYTQDSLESYIDKYIDSAKALLLEEGRLGLPIEKDKMFAYVYNQIMRSYHRREDIVSVNFTNIYDIINNGEAEQYLYEVSLSKAAMTTYTLVENRCNECNDKGNEDCSSCIMRHIYDIEWEKLIPQLSLECPSLKRDALNVFNEMFTEEKMGFFVGFCFDNHKENYIKSSIEIQKILVKNAFLSTVIADPRDLPSLRRKIIENAIYHNEIYRDYDKVVTRFFEDTIEFNNIISDRDYNKLENKEDTTKIIELKPVSFIKRDNIGGIEYEEVAK